MPYSLVGCRITEKIKETAHSILYRGHRISDDVPVVLKRLKEDDPTPQELAAYRIEFEITQRISAPNVIQTYAQHQDGGSLIIVMEDFGGVALRDLFTHTCRPLDKFLDIALQATRGLVQVHKAGVIHRDISPANLLINPESGLVKVADFGIADTQQTSMCQMGAAASLLGTPAYMSPEQTGRMNRSVDYRTDFYSLGAVFYRLLTGERPFPSEDPMTVVHGHIARTPTPPREKCADIPKVLSDLVMKLMSKEADHRYSKARALEEDLQRCLDLWREHEGEIPPFELGLTDYDDRFHLSQTIYGRDTALATLQRCFQQCLLGKPVLVQVKGQSGIGKTSLIQELFKPLTQNGGLFTAGKYEQYNRGRPLSALLDALERLLHQLLGEPQDVVQKLALQIQQALGMNMGIAVNLLPTLSRFIGEHEKVYESDSTAMRNRVLLTLSRLIHTICTQDTPLVVFLDDLQWADEMTLSFLEWPELSNNTSPLMLIGAYRDNEVGRSHPLSLTLERLDESNWDQGCIQVTALPQSGVRQLLADSFKWSSEEADGLSRLVFEKTHGNPFFVIQFITNLHKEGLIFWQQERAGWTWDEKAVRERNFTDNLVEMMVNKLRDLPPDTQAVLQTAACLGARFKLKHTAACMQGDQRSTYQSLQAALAENFIFPTGPIQLLQDEALSPVYPEFKFGHDKIQQAAYELIPADQVARVHFQIGVRLYYLWRENTSAIKIESFTDHLNKSPEAWAEDDDRLRLARFNHNCGDRAMQQAAHVRAVEYFERALALYRGEEWPRNQTRALHLHLHYTLALKSQGDNDGAERCLRNILTRDLTNYERVETSITLGDLLQTTSRHQECKEVGLECFGLLNVHIPQDYAEQTLPIIHEILELYRQVKLEDLPSCLEPDQLLFNQAYESCFLSFYYQDINLYSYLSAIAVRSLLQKGYTPSSPAALACFGSVLKLRNMYREAAVAGEAAQRLSEMVGRPLFIPNPAVRLRFDLRGFYEHFWPQVLQSIETGKLFYADFLSQDYAAFQIVCYEPILPEVFFQRIEDLGRKYNFTVTPKVLEISRRLERVLREKDYCYEFLQEEILSQDSDLFLRLILLQSMSEIMLALGDTAAARKVSDEHLARRELLKGGVFYEMSFSIRAAILGAQYPAASEQEKTEIRAELDAYSRTLGMTNQLSHHNWSAQHYHLVRAERLRIAGHANRTLLAYTEALKATQSNSSILREGLIHERMADYLGELGFALYRRLHLREALRCYRRCGMVQRLEDLERRADETAQDEPMVSATAGNTHSRDKRVQETGADTFDLQTLLKASRAISRNLNLDELLREMISILMENAGAQRGLLLLKESDEAPWLIRVKADADAEPQMEQRPFVDAPDLAQRIVRYVIQSGEALVLEDALGDPRFKAAPYIQDNKIRALLCKAIQVRGATRCVLYLENNLSAGAFTTSHLKSLEPLATQMAVSLENAMLYTDLERHNQDLEARVQRRTQELRTKNAELEDKHREILDKNQELAHKNQEILAAQQKLIEQEKMASLGVMTAGVAHEINNPANYVAGGAANLNTGLDYLEAFLLELAEGAPPEIHQALRDRISPLRMQCAAIREGADRIATIVKDLRTFTHASESVWRRIDLNSALSSAISVLQADREHLITFHTSFCKDLTLECSPTDLYQAFLNILRNACEAVVLNFGEVGETGRQGKVEVVTQRINGDAVICISDNGVGMTPEVAEKIFQPFYTTKQVGAGTGLGLSTAYGTVKKHGGRIEVQAEVCKGSRFSIILPLQGADGPAQD